MTQVEQRVHCPMLHQQTTQIVALQSQAGHHTQRHCHTFITGVVKDTGAGVVEDTGLVPGGHKTVHTGLDLDTQHQLHHPGEGGADESDELDQRHLLRVLPHRELDAVAEVEQLLLLVLDLLQLETPG